MDGGTIAGIFAASAGAMMVLSSFVVRAGFGEAKVLENRFNGERGRVVQGPAFSLKKPSQRAARFTPEVEERDATGQSVLKQSDRSAKTVDTLENTFRLFITNIPTEDGVDVSFRIDLPLQVFDPKRFISVSNNPMSTTLAEIAAEITPILKGYDLDSLRGDRTSIEQKIKEKVEESYVTVATVKSTQEGESDIEVKANKYGIALNKVIISDPDLPEAYKIAMARKSSAVLDGQAAETEGRSLGSKVRQTALGMAGHKTLVFDAANEDGGVVEVDTDVINATAESEAAIQAGADDAAANDDVELDPALIKLAAEIVQTEIAAKSGGTVIVSSGGPIPPASVRRAANAGAPAPGQ